MPTLGSDCRSPELLWLVFSVCEGLAVISFASSSRGADACGNWGLFASVDRPSAPVLVSETSAEMSVEEGALSLAKTVGFRSAS